MKTAPEATWKRAMGRTGLSVSPLGFGSAPIGLLKTGQKQVDAILNKLLDVGVNLIDTAAGYEGAEEAIAKAVIHRRKDYMIVSKCGPSFRDLMGAAWSEQLISATVDRSLKRLQTDCIDIMLLHSCDLDTLQRGEAIHALVKARDVGKIRYVGYSGDNEAAAFASTLPDISVVEISLSMVDQANIECVLPLAIENDIGLIVKRPLANAAWRPLESQQGFYQEYAKSYHERFNAMGLCIEAFQLENDVLDWAELALRFALSQPGVHTAIVGTTKLENVRRNIEVSMRPALPIAAVRQIREAFNRARQQGGQTWSALG